MPPVAGARAAEPSLRGGALAARGRDLVGLAREVLAFAVAGSLGFLAHAVVLSVLVHGLGVPAYPAWFPAFAVAVTVTYAVNRGWTFRARAGSDRGREYARYVLLQSAGAALNYATYAAALWTYPLLQTRPVAALALGALAGMVANYLTARQLAFTGGRMPVAAVPRRLRA
jgi:putative flippase GtrA